MDERIKRIAYMEALFDDIKIAMRKSHMSIFDERIKEKIDILLDYYDNGQWLKDYEADEAGLIPKDIKRGVLSQDGVYDLISEIENIKKAPGVD